MKERKKRKTLGKIFTIELRTLPTSDSKQKVSLIPHLKLSPLEWKISNPASAYGVLRIKLLDFISSNGYISYLVKKKLSHIRLYFNEKKENEKS